MSDDSTHPTTDVYRALAQRLDEIPNGFPPTESGVELELLAKIFAPEEAALAAMMTTTPEGAATIAARAGVDAKKAYRTLKGMVRHGLIWMKRDEADDRQQILFALMPFVVGFYEAQLPRMDEEMARRFEAYFQASRGLEMPEPSVHRVIPVGEAVRSDVEIQPYEQAVAMIEGARSWGVRDCICRTQQHLIGEGCDAPIESCLVFAPVENAFAGSSENRPLSKDEALGVLHQAEEAGLVHTVGNHQHNHFYICNCCTCCCGVLRRVTEFAVPTAVARSAFRAVVAADLCIGCGTCVDRCQFDALSVPDGTAVVNAARCVGCGLCATACPVDAPALERRPADEITPPPETFDAWLAARQDARHTSS